MSLRPLALLVVAALSAPLASAAEPLHVRIDRLLAATPARPVSPPADDGEFLRRATLDFAGTVPTADVARAFLADRTPGKRGRLMDALLANPAYADRMADAFHLTLMERLGDHAGWKAYLRESFAANKSWDRLAREMLRADPADGPAKAAAFFLSKRLENYGQNPVDHAALTRDVGRLFLGKDFRCCECHDHLTIDEYTQRDFQGLHAFFRNAVLVDAAAPRVGETPTAGAFKFASVFTKVEMATGPALPGGGPAVEVPVFPKGQEFTTPPDRKANSPGVPKFRTLAAAADAIPAAANRDFARNGANRLWFLLMGRGVVHPPDATHAGNPPSNPALMELLAGEFAAHQFDIKLLLREIALSEAYGRSGAASGAPDPRSFATALEKRLSAEQLFAATQVAAGDRLPDAARAKFVKAYANPPREPEEQVEPSLKAALFVLNDEAVAGLLKPKPGNLVDRLARLPDAAAVADELYLAVLTRRPTAGEAATVAAVLARHGGRREAAAAKLAWALLASTEFGVNH